QHAVRRNRHPQHQQNNTNDLEEALHRLRLLIGIGHRHNLKFGEPVRELPAAHTANSVGPTSQFSWPLFTTFYHHSHEGAIPFTRSIDYQGLLKECSKSAVNATLPVVGGSTNPVQRSL